MSSPSERSLLLCPECEHSDSWHHFEDDPRTPEVITFVCRSCGTEYGPFILLPAEKVEASSDLVN